MGRPLRPAELARGVRLGAAHPLAHTAPFGSLLQRLRCPLASRARRPPACERWNAAAPVAGPHPCGGLLEGRPWRHGAPVNASRTKDEEEQGERLDAQPGESRSDTRLGKRLRE